MITPQEFIERYNRIVGWNIDILKSFGREQISENGYVKDIIEDVFETEPITEQVYDFKTAKVTELINNTAELQIYGWSRRYFSIRLDDVFENEYKERKIRELMEYVENERKLIEENTNELMKRKLGTDMIEKMVSNYNRDKSIEKNISSVPSKSEFIKMICNLADERPEGIRYGQSIYNNVDKYFGVAREVASNDIRIDCYYEDSNVDIFLDECWNLIVKKKENKK